MNFLKSIQLIICYFLLVSSAFAEAGAHIVFANPENTNESAIQKELQSSEDIESVVALINDNFRLPTPLYFVFGGEDGPLYDGQKNEIVIPYSFVQEIKNRFIKAKYSETGITANEAAMDALIHTMFHELAHAFVLMYDLPVLGKEEDAADGLATVLLIDFFENGQEISISAADLFDLESEDTKVLEDEDFWDEHSLDAKRFYSTLCLVYGSDPEKYAYLLKEEDLTEEWAERCVVEYENTSRSWFVLLKPHIKHNKENSVDHFSR